MIHFGKKLESRKVFQLLSRSIPYYLHSWRDLDQESGLFGALDPVRFNMRDIGSSSPVIEYVVRPHIQILVVLAAFCASDSDDLLPEGTTRQMLEVCLCKGVRFACQTHLTGTRNIPEFLERQRWGENWRSSFWAALLGLSGHLARTIIGDELYQQVQKVVAFEADRFINVSPPSGFCGDTKVEENAGDTMVIAWAINLCQEYEQCDRWKESLQQWALNIATSIKDKSDHSEYFGGSVAASVSTQTLFPDMTAENHGFFYPEILSYSSWVILAMAAYSLTGNQPPPFFVRKNHQDTYEVLLKFCMPNGLFYNPSAHDLPLFIPRPFAHAWGLWHNDPRAMFLTTRLLSWMDEVCVSDKKNIGPWIFGFDATYAGWELFFQSQAGFELSMLSLLPAIKESRQYTSGQIENALDTRHIYPYIQICYRRTTNITRSVAWKAIGNHPSIGFSIHSFPELVVPSKAGLLGVPQVGNRIKHTKVAFHRDHLIRDGFDTQGRILYGDADSNTLLVRDVRVVTWGDDGLLVLDRITAEQDVEVDDQFLSPICLVNDHWTHNQLNFISGSLKETFISQNRKNREISCPSFWASIGNTMLFQFVYGRTKGLVYIPGGERNAPPFWENCRLDRLAVALDAQSFIAGETVYEVGFYVGIGKSPRVFKSTGTPQDFFKGLVFMDGKITVGLD